MSDISIKQINQLNKKIFVQFGGQGTAYFKELIKYYQDDRFNLFFETVFRAIKDISTETETYVLPKGLDLQSWLEDLESAPDELTLSTVGISFGMIQVTQLAHIENLFLNGISKEEIYQATYACSGHSQGLIPACFYALNLTGEKYYQALAIFVKYLFLMGFRAQETYPQTFASKEEITRSTEIGAPEPSPMVAILGGEHSKIKKMVTDFNINLSDSQKVYISLLNTPSNRVLSAPRSSLIEFHQKNKIIFEKENIKFIYLKTSCPFHSPHLFQAIDRFKLDIDKISFNWTGSDLKIPVYSFSSDYNLQQEKDLGLFLCRELMVNTVDWIKTITPPATNDDIQYFIDIGPGKTSQRLSLECLRAINIDKSVFAIATNKDQKKIF